MNLYAMNIRNLGVNMKLLIIISLLAVSACGPTLIMLKNPTTKEIVRCTGGSTMTSIVRQVNETKICAQAYEKNGYERID